MSEAKMHESGENYLETILVLRNTRGVVHSVDVARALNFSKPSVSRAMGILRKAGYIEVDPTGCIELTEPGLEKARQIYSRHTTLTAFLRDIIGVDAQIAEENACRMEHILDQIVMDGITDFMNHCTRGCMQGCGTAEEKNA